MRVLKTDTRVSKKTLAFRKDVGDSVSVRFKDARVEKMPLNIRIQRNAGTACVRAKNASVSGFACRPSKGVASGGTPKNEKWGPMTSKMVVVVFGSSLIQAPNFENSDPENMPLHTPSHSRAPRLASLPQREPKGCLIKGALNLLIFGIPSFGIPAFGMPVFGITTFGIAVFGIPDFGIPGFGNCCLAESPSVGFPSFGIPVFGIPVFGIPDFGVPGFGIPTFRISGELRHPLYNQTPLRLPPSSYQPIKAQTGPGTILHRYSL